MDAVILSAEIFGAAVPVAFLGTRVYAGIIAGPFVPVPREVIEPALQLAAVKPGDRLYDLGSGTGSVLIVAARKFRARGTGFELSLQHYLISVLKIWSYGCADKIDVHWRNFLHEDISGADAIFCWLTPRAYPKLKNKFEKELRPGTRVVAYSSAIGFWKPDKIIKAPTGADLFLYIKT